MAESSKVDLDSAELYALFPESCVAAITEFGDEPCSLVQLSVSLALHGFETGKLTHEQAFERVQNSAHKIASSGCTGKWLKDDPGCFTDPVDCGQNRDGFNEYIN